ncbi:hypothetical protein [Deinococcus sp. UYEF24]
MTKPPFVVRSEYQTLLEHTAQQPTLRRPMTAEDVARITASSLRLEGFETSAEELSSLHEAHQNPGAKPRS